MCRYRTRHRRPPVWAVLLSLSGLSILISAGRAGADSLRRDAGPTPAAVDVAGSLHGLIEADYRAADPQCDLRRVLQRGRALAARLRRQQADAAQLDARLAELAKIESDTPKTGPAEQGTSSERQTRYLAARWIVRQIALLNPLLAIDRLLFVKRHEAGGPYHMCDQFYGYAARPGGGLFVLENPFGPRPRLVDLLATATVQHGRLSGQRLAGGSPLSPEVAFDGRTVLFAYTQAQGRDLEWSPTACYHIFSVGSDGGHLEQLTDGPYDDFDPCFLPNGRIAFISERRGGYLRCGRHCPNYTLFGMAADGRDITCLSFHETHEWQPSVTNDGLLVYTRWDYVDRDTNAAHHPWICYPDGRDPRSLHGNYPLRREGRPWMEMNVRAIPGSQKFVATAAAHHGHAFGSLVLLDPRIPDDGAAAQLERLTPEVPFPEAEGDKKTISRLMVYGTPWPLSEDDYLCCYDAAARNHGLYWIDRAGNRELIYRDPEIASISPLPLRARPRPPVLPDAVQARAGAAASSGAPPATIGVMNVYDADFAWPPATRITALRIVQVLPKSTAPPNEPRIGIGNQTNARAVLGTVPVEADGSAYFQAPPGKALYFQALDERGLAVQSMRSATYAHPGEQLLCQGCHEDKRRPRSLPSATPLALQRPPSRIAPDVDGSNPFSYVRLVQPVLDRQCVECHRQRRALDLSGTIEGKLDWSRSYSNLAKKYATYYDSSNGSLDKPAHGGSRSPAGHVGARAARLMEYLDPRHYGVQLSDADRRRLTLWLDCNSDFFGSYENTAAQARGAIVRPTLE